MTVAAPLQEKKTTTITTTINIILKNGDNNNNNWKTRIHGIEDNFLALRNNKLYLISTIKTLKKKMRRKNK